MKKAPLYLLLAFFGAMMFASCKKDYTCQCSVGVPFVFDTVVTIEIEDVKKKQAKIACENNESAIRISSSAMLTAAINQLTGGIDSLTGGITIPAELIMASCELK
jgi:hypothetical protein